MELSSFTFWSCRGQARQIDRVYSYFRPQKALQDLLKLSVGVASDIQPSHLGQKAFLIGKILQYLGSPKYCMELFKLLWDR